MENEKANEFIKNNPTAEVIVYENGVPTGGAGTRGFGDPGQIRVLLVNPETFKTRNSPHVVLDGVWRVRRDYGAKKGFYAKCLKDAEKSADWWETRLGL